MGTVLSYMDLDLAERVTFKTELENLSAEQCADLAQHHKHPEGTPPHPPNTRRFPHEAPETLTEKLAAVRIALLKQNGHTIA